VRWITQNDPTVSSPPRAKLLPRRPDLLVTLVVLVGLLLASGKGFANDNRLTVASWYGEAHRGRLMANGKKFNPDRLTAASWFYALGTRVRVTSADKQRRSVVVTITDRGPSWELVRDGRKIDLSHAAFRRLAAPENGLVEVKLDPVH